MHTLADEKVILSKKGGPAISKEEIESLVSQKMGWDRLNEDLDKLIKAY